MFERLPRKAIAVLLALASSSSGGAVTYRYLANVLGTNRRNVRRAVALCQNFELVRVVSVRTGRGALSVVMLAEPNLFGGLAARSNA